VGGNRRLPNHNRGDSMLTLLLIIIILLLIFGGGYGYSRRGRV
jgi:hypothetical protein